MNDSSENKLSKFIIAINSGEMIEKLSKVVLSASRGKLYLCFPKAQNQRADLHLLLEAENVLEFFEQSALTSKIQEKLGYDHTVDAEAEIVLHQYGLFKQEKIDDVYEDKVCLDRENFEGGSIKKFLSTYYPEYVKFSRHSVSPQKTDALSLEETARYLSELPESEFEAVLQKARELRIEVARQKLISSK